MQLSYNGVDLATLGELRILAHSTQREPVEAPQRERVTYRVRLDFFEQSFAANFGRIEQLRAALKTQSAVLTWVDDTGKQYLNRTVTAAEDEAEAGLERGGTQWQGIVFTFWFYNHDVVTNCLNATVRRADGQAPARSLGAVLEWKEVLTSVRFDEFRDQRKRVGGTVTASGRFQADTTQPLATRQAALLALKDQLLADLTADAAATLAFGTFNQNIRVDNFTAEVNQPQNFLAWQLTANFTRYPDETNYAVLEFSLAPRFNQADGIHYLTLSGKIQSPNETAARARLAALQASVIPSAYVTLDTRTEAKSVGMESGAGGDGIAFTELTFTVEYRDPATLTCTYQRTTANAVLADLGTVDKFAHRFAVTLFDELRSNRKRAAGTASLGGKWYAADTLSAVDKAAALQAQLNLFETEMIGGSSGTLVYGTVLNQIVRLVDWDAHINRLTNCIEWSLTASYTAYPNESDYALCEFNVDTRQNQADGTVLMALTGRIGAPTATAAQAKLARLRTAVIPTGYTLLRDQTTERRVDVESGRNSTSGDQGDGTSFIELTVNDEWQLTTGSLLTWSLRTANDTDNKTGWTHTTYAGTVQAVAATQAAAFTAAANQAATLGGGKFPFLLRSNVTSLDKLFQTAGGKVFVTVEFSYEYQTKGALTYLEVTSELNADSFGQTTETVSGYVVAPTLAIAQAVYQADVRNVAAYNGALILSERTPTLMQQRLKDASNALLAAFDDRFTFSLQLFRSKTAASIAYTTEPQSNLQSNDTTTTIRGTVWAGTQTAAEALLQTVLAAVAPSGALTMSTRNARLKRGPVAGTGVTSGDIFEAMDFAVTYVSALTGASGILESEVSEEFIYSGMRNIEKMIPDGISIIQQAGITCGRHTITARCVSTTPTAAQAWIRTIRTGLLQSLTTGNPNNAVENPPRVRTGYQFLPQIAGVPVGTGANVKLFEVNAEFSELVPELAFV